jgi:hypothetical protein
MFYEINKVVTNMYDGQGLKIQGHVKVYTDEAKENYLTELPFNELGVPSEQLVFANISHSTKAEFDQAVEGLVMPYVEAEAIQAKLEEVRIAKELGIL